MKGPREPKAALHANRKRRKSCRRRLQVLQLRFVPSKTAAEARSSLEDGRRVASADKNSSTSSTESSDDSSRRGEQATDACGGGGEGPSAGSKIGDLVYGHVSMMGRRRAMEDKVTVAPLGWMAGEYYFFAVYDGHGGDKVAEKCGEKLHTCLARHIEKAKKLPEERDIDWEKVMADCFISMDEEIDRNDGAPAQGEDCAAAAAAYKNMGSTAAVVLVGKVEMVVANCGDSRAVLCRGGVAIPMSTDHKPDREDEKERIEAAGGEVINWNGWRVQGVLATSRSLGDQYLKPYVTSVPEVSVVSRSDSDEFLIIATDGLFDVISNEVACEVVKRCLDNNSRSRRHEAGASHAATLLAELAIAKGSKDNISVIVVQLNK
ncbi:hypothetical protein ABFS82_01G061800 [Erythranthe guttata]|uniref:protein-serine/threonine phosphatase n=1 Tax=Erythranthe guttata TaxID=4155 RepID=A0A022Q3W2_ERYGU|nr:PREDICTED: probable protein phosphatase 2C 51 [Erythranthe guttata]EYU23352.1 hypothetical protein MIMGU_mgv1a021730mg [Erythranthe guttata]|eukprot:XP_012854118.1 PREDICTED: probable protein phosphatase 2C 51 [Erythranthe guttata]